MVMQTRASAKADTLSQEKMTPSKIPPTATSSKINIHQHGGLSIATWNVQGGLKSGADFACVANDFRSRKVDIGCLQETHCHSGAPWDSEDGKLICLEDSSKSTPAYRKYGLGFFVGRSLAEHVVDYRLVSNRIAVLRLQNVVYGDTCNPQSKFSKLCIVNVYAPTSQRAVKKPEEYQGFYDQLNEIVRECKSQSSFVVIAGDFNSKLGLREKVDGGELESFMGNFGKGTRNRNGRYMASFVKDNDLYAANTHCRHSMRHRSTWGGILKSHADGTMMRIHNQIDYVCVQARMIKAIISGRAYWGCRFNSDHAMVVVKLNMKQVYKCRKVATNGRKPGVSNPLKKVQISSLVSSPELRDEYEKKVSQYIMESPDIQDLVHIISKAACEVIPPSKKLPDGKIQYCNDISLTQWSVEQTSLLNKLRTIRIDRLMKEENEIRKARSNIKVKMRKRIKHLQEDAVKNLAEELENTPDAQRQYAIVRALKRKEAFAPYQLKDANGYVSISPVNLINTTQAFYEKFFNSSTLSDAGALEPFGEDEGALEFPITEEEIAGALFKLRNGRAVGPDGINGELLKYGGRSVVSVFTADINNMFISRVFRPYLSEGLLIPLNKPGKPRVVEHTRPITLLNTRRKALSIVVLCRIFDGVDKYLPRSQCGFRRRRSSMDIAWLYSWLRAVGYRYQRVIHVNGIDMSKAFDCIIRKKLIFILRASVGLRRTEIQVIQSLMSVTTLQVKIGNTIGAKFSTTIGVPQGDALSPILFAIYLEAAMREVRELDNAIYCGAYVGRDWFHEVMEASYADDVDFLCTNAASLEQRLQKCVPIFQEKYNLTVNESKTEKVMISNDLHMATGYKKLGSHVDAPRDLVLRIGKAHMVFKTLWTLWKCNTIQIETRLRVYNACVKPILLYNIGAQAFTVAQVAKMNSTHRRHLKVILGIFYPYIISNEMLYQRTKQHPLHEDILAARWRCLRSALYQDIMDERLPMPCIMRLWFHNHFGLAVKRRGAPPTTLPLLIHKDLESVGRKFKTPQDYKELKEMVTNEQEWKAMVLGIISRTSLKMFEKARRIRTRRKKREAEQLLTRVDHQIEDISKRQRIVERDAELTHSAGLSGTQNPLVDKVVMPETPMLANIDPIIRRSTRKRSNDLIPIPDTLPVSKKKRQQVHVVAILPQENVERNNRLSGNLNVYNSVISSRTF